MKTREEILSRHDYHIYSPEEGTLHVVDYWDALDAMEEYKNQGKFSEEQREELDRVLHDYYRKWKVEGSMPFLDRIEQIVYPSI